MRPQRNAGEYGTTARCRPSRRTGFNEAPAKCRGIRARSGGTARMTIISFNEAPAKCRGIRRDRQQAAEERVQASMRPQRNAGEYAKSGDELEVKDGTLQ